MVYRARAGQSESSAVKATLDAHPRIAVSNRRTRLSERVTGPTAALEGEQANRGAPSSDDMRPAFPALVLGSTDPAELRRVVTDHDDLLVLVWHRNDGEFLSHQTPNLVPGV